MEGGKTMTREQIEEQIAVLTREITQLNADIQRISYITRKRDELRGELQKAQLKWLKLNAGIEITPLFKFKGKTKDLLADLQSEIQKAQQI